MNQQWDTPPADGDYSHYVERLNEQAAEGTPQPAPAVTLQQAAQARRVVRFATFAIAAFLLVPVFVSLWQAWQFLHQFGPLPALLTVITGAGVPLIMLVFVMRILRHRVTDVVQKLERNIPHAPES